MNCEPNLTVAGKNVKQYYPNLYASHLQNGSVTDCYVSVHSFGAWYTWNETTNNFQFVDGEPWHCI